MPEGNRILVAAYDEVAVRDVATHERVRRFEAKSVRRISVHPSGRLLALYNSSAAEIRMLSGALMHRLDTSGLYPSDVTLSPDGQYLLMVASPKSFIWRVASLLGR
jgi:hypothetical protein